MCTWDWEPWGTVFWGLSNWVMRVLLLAGISQSVVFCVSCRVFTKITKNPLNGVQKTNKIVHCLLVGWFNELSAWELSAQLREQSACTESYQTVLRVISLIWALSAWDTLIIGNYFMCRSYDGSSHLSNDVLFYQNVWNVNSFKSWLFLHQKLVKMNHCTLEYSTQL